MPKRKLINVAGNSFFVSDNKNEVTAVGVYIFPNEKKFVLFDSGLSEAIAKEIMSSIKYYDPNLQLFAIVNTHHHVDHIGGNKYLQTITPDLKIFATKKEKPFIEWPELEITCFSCGAEPIKEMHSKHLKAENSNITDVIEESKKEIDVLGVKFQIISTPGHTFGHIGIVTPDKVFYTGDAILGKASLEKHFIPLNVNVKEALLSYECILKLTPEHTVVYHGGLLNNSLTLSALVKLHIEKMENLKMLIKEALINNSFTLEDLTAAITKDKVPTASESAIVFLTLARTSIQAFLTYLQEQGEVKFSIKDGKQMYELSIQPTVQLIKKM